MQFHSFNYNIMYNYGKYQPKYIIVSNICVKNNVCIPILLQKRSSCAHMIDIIVIIISTIICYIFKSSRLKKRREINNMDLNILNQGFYSHHVAIVLNYQTETQALVTSGFWLCWYDSIFSKLNY